MDLVVSRVLDGVTLAAILALISLGLAVIFGLMRVINLAHGDFFTSGLYVIVALQPVFGFWVAALMSAIIVGALGALVQVSLIRWLWERPLETLLATWGVGMVIREVINLIWGAGYRQVGVPIQTQVQIGSFHYSLYRLILVGLALALAGAVVLMLFKTQFGLRLRAALDDRETAAAHGVSPERVNVIAFATGAGLAGIAGALMAPLVTVFPLAGLAFLAQAFFVVIIGGAGRIAGVFAGAMVIGAVATVTAAYVSPLFSQVIVLSVAIVVMRFRPQGLFAT
jgi:branched-chain amino acid transport system permease protein/urea transport system permease protein